MSSCARITPRSAGRQAAPCSNGCVGSPPASGLGLSLLPNVNVAAATSISQGRRRRNASFDVRTRSIAPASPPSTLVTPSRISHCRDERSSRRYASVLDTDAGQSASVDVALATTAGTPATMSAGSVRNDPPPATALSAPPMAAATKSKMLTRRRLAGCVLHEARLYSSLLSFPPAILQFCNAAILQLLRSDRAPQRRSHPAVDHPSGDRAGAHRRRHHR